MPGLADAAAFFFAPLPLALMLLGVTAGVFVGAVPGLTGAMLIALSLPLTFGMQPAAAMVLLTSMYVGSISGGLITATLLRMPGTPASMMTTLDGYPLARSGQAGRALGLGVTASFVGGMVSWLFLVVLSKPMAVLSTRLGPYEMFSLIAGALVLIAAVSGASLSRGVLAGLLGILVAIPGTSPADGGLRWTLGFAEMNDGFKLLPVLIGLFAVSQIIADIVHIDAQHEGVPVSRRGMFLSASDWRGQGVNLARSSLIGTWIGILPGVGANIGSAVAYSAAKNSSKTPERFGHGAEEGIVASEAANNATVGGALIPLISLGIPGSVIDAILLGALVIHGLQPGPLLFRQNPDVVYTIMLAVLLANFAMFAVMVLSVRWIAKLAEIPKAYLVPVILVFCVVGSYALSNRFFDVGVMLAFGVIGYAMERLGVPPAPFVIGFVLAPLLELNLPAGLMRFDGSLLPLITRPISAVFLAMAAALLVWSLRRRG